jgi:putative ABC transport system substrate-binding protein
VRQQATGGEKAMKIFFLFGLLATFVLTTGPTQAQAKKVARIGYLSGTDGATDSPRAEGIRRALRELGYIEGQNIAIEYRHAKGNPDRYPELTADLVRLKVDLIVVAGGTTPIRAAVKATKTIPIVMTGTGLDPVRAGLIESLARPGGNVTGLTTLNTELASKRLELFKEAVPTLVRVAILYNPANPGASREVKEDVPVAAQALGLSVRNWEIRALEDFDKTFAALSKERPDGLYAPLAGGLMRENVKRIVAFTLKSRLPSIYDEREAVEAGGFISYEANQVDRYRRVAYYIDKILQGAKPADLPVEQPTKFEFVVNLKTAKHIGLAIPPNVLARADRVIR